MADRAVLHFDDAQAVLQHVERVLAAPEASAGEVIEWKGASTLVGGNLRQDQPGVMWPVYVDGYGRFWREEHPFVGDSPWRRENRLVCILDLRRGIGSSGRRVRSSVSAEELQAYMRAHNYNGTHSLIELALDDICGADR